MDAGWTSKQLEAKGLRKDFLVFLDSVVEQRNYIAHNLLADKALMDSIIKPHDDDHYGKFERTLDKAIYELEQVIFLFDSTNANNGWGPHEK